MIGVLAKPTDHAAVREFFQLFKTPWEFFESGRQYEVLVCAEDIKPATNDAKLLVVYGGRELAIDAEYQLTVHPTKNSHMSYKSSYIPIYGEKVTFSRFAPKATSILMCEESQRTSIFVAQSSGGVLARMGYDLFSEVSILLGTGQPAKNADSPTLDLHIALLRELIIDCGITAVEIPPVPNGYKFIACLTHDVDHPCVRRHKLDHTMWGFLYRAVFGSFINFARGRASARNLLKNWAAALKLPFVYMGLAADFWEDFVRYSELEKGFPSSFFFIPFSKYPGRRENGQAPSRRASGYGVADIPMCVQQLRRAGCEIGVHGIDGWIDSSKGREELEEVRRISSAPATGVRMHWLYFNEKSPVILEDAGAEFDSTVGYNETVGYRAGTTQVFKPLATQRLLELPLHVMDTALFYPSYLHLTEEEAKVRVGGIIENAVRFGGVITVNWHDRSIAPERLWGEFYTWVVDELEKRGAWFATTSQAVSWFRRRRDINLESLQDVSDSLSGRTMEDNLPGMCLGILNSQERRRASVNC